MIAATFLGLSNQSDEGKMNQILVDPQYLEFFETIPIRLSCITNSGWPSVISLWYHFDGKDIFCATQKSAKIVKYLRANNMCAFEIARESPPYRGIRGQGLAIIRVDIGKKTLETLIDRYLKNNMTSLANSLRQKSETEVAIQIKPTKLFVWDYSKRLKD